MRAAGMPPESQAQTMTLAAKVELLRAHFGIANELNVAAVVSTASERLDLNVASMSIAAKADACINALGTTVEGAPPWEVPPTSTSQTRATEMTLMDKIEKLRTYFGLAKELPIATVISTAIERLGLSVSAGSNIVSKADACLAAIAATSEAAPEHVDLAEVVPMATPVEMQQPVMATPVMVQGVMLDEGALAMEARAREAEQRVQRAEAELRIREAEQRAQAAEQALAQQSRMAALEKALRDAMPGWLNMWSDRNTTALQTAIAQAEAAAPPAGSSLLATLTEAKAVLRSQVEAKARKEEEERARKEAEERNRQPQVEFIASAKFAGSKPGYAFKMGPKGMGYYCDDGKITPVAQESWEAANARHVAEERARREASMEGVWEPTRESQWQNCPVPLHDRRLYQMTIRGDGSWKGGRAGSYIEADNFHGSVQASGKPSVRQGRGHDNTHGDYPCRFTLLSSGELECAFGDFSVKYYFTRAGSAQVCPRFLLLLSSHCSSSPLTPPPLLSLLLSLYLRGAQPSDASWLGQATAWVGGVASQMMAKDLSGSWYSVARNSGAPNGDRCVPTLELGTTLTLTSAAAAVSELLLLLLQLRCF